MARKSLEQIVDFITAWGNAHASIKKVGADFVSEMGEILTESERYQALFIALDDGVSLGEGVNTFELEIYCLDIIQKNRANIISVVSDTGLTLNDLFLELSDGENTDFETDLIGEIERVNNSMLDYLAGSKMRVRITVESYSVCEIPVGDFIEPQTPCPAGTVINSEGTILLTVPAGGVETLQDVSITFVVNGVESTVTVPAGKNETINLEWV